MSTQNQIELALALWANGEREQFKAIIAKEKSNILNYNGRGDVLSYFMPALLLEDFWSDLQDSGFPMQKIVASSFDVVGWLSWKKATEYMALHQPDFINDIKENGLFEEAYSPMLFRDEENLETTLDYYNTQLRSLVESAIDEYMNRSDEDWEKIIASI